eukprot:189909-Lingulodinium_polyedra.AAC.1
MNLKRNRSHERAKKSRNGQRTNGSTLRKADRVWRTSRVSTGPGLTTRLTIPDRQKAQLTTTR